MSFGLNLLKEIHTQETFQQQKVLNRDTALVGQRTVTAASLGLQRRIAWSTGKIALIYCQSTWTSNQEYNGEILCRSDYFRVVCRT
ncbi:MAG: hypothetical protein O4805_03785, partial [Trichodesmium sp. St16_bin2-tuft]|nr:hypothetical protein [Trichodesmium sp. St16_bin2-tuft]